MIADQIYVIADNGIGYEIGSTSAATPLWAGFMALVNEQNAASGKPAGGLFQPGALRPLSGNRICRLLP